MKCIFSGGDIFVGMMFSHHQASDRKRGGVFRPSNTSSFEIWFLEFPSNLTK